MCLGISSYWHFYFKIAHVFSINHIGYSQIPKINCLYMNDFSSILSIATEQEQTLIQFWICCWPRMAGMRSTNCLKCYMQLVSQCHLHQDNHPNCASYCEVVSHHWCPGSSIADATPGTAIKVFDETLLSVGLMGTNTHEYSYLSGTFLQEIDLSGY